MSDSERAHSGVDGPVEISPRGPLGSDRVAFHAYSGGSAYQRSLYAELIRAGYEPDLQPPGSFPQFDGLIPHNLYSELSEASGKLEVALLLLFVLFMLDLT